MVIYGSKMYIAVAGESTIEITGLEPKSHQGDKIYKEYFSLLEKKFKYGYNKYKY